VKLSKEEKKALKKEKKRLAKQATAEAEADGMVVDSESKEKARRKS
jgi:hypothetical protein